MKSKVDEAVECFNNGLNCSQAILSTYCEQFGFNKETAIKLSCGFGAGMGKLGKTCGAVTGAYLLIGLKYGEEKEKTYQLVQAFEKRFVKRNKTTDCKELLGVDLLHDDKEKAKQRVSEICSAVVKDAAEMIEDILAAVE